MLNDASGFQHVYLCTGYTDLRKGIDGLISIVTGTFGLDPTEAGSIFLFCGRKKNTMKALYFDRDGFVLLQKRLDNGKFQWPRNASEVRPLTRQEFRWLMEGLSIEQKKVIHKVKPELY